MLTLGCGKFGGNSRLRRSGWHHHDGTATVDNKRAILVDVNSGRNSAANYVVNGGRRSVKTVAVSFESKVDLPMAVSAADVSNASGFEAVVFAVRKHAEPGNVQRTGAVFHLAARLFDARQSPPSGVLVVLQSFLDLHIRQPENWRRFKLRSKLPKIGFVLGC